ncbi:MAG: hypothetical protein IPK97_18240 [Ahniella sp.]|nr:hypothetical protein [Ahniella sp.]
MLADGSGLDPTFSTDGAVHILADQVAAVGADSQGRIVMVGTRLVSILGGMNTANLVLVARWLANGSTDSDFADFGKESSTFHMEKPAIILVAHWSSIIWIGFSPVQRFERTTMVWISGCFACSWMVNRISTSATSTLVAHASILMSPDKPVPMTN